MNLKMFEIKRNKNSFLFIFDNYPQYLYAKYAVSDKVNCVK